MAAFNPEVSATPSSNFVNASQGMPANKSLGTLFETIAGAVDAQYKSNEAQKADQLGKDVQAGVDAIDKSTVGDVGSLFEGQKADTTGPLAPSSKALSKLKSAYDQGKLDEMGYKLQVATLSKKLRAQYPQFSDKIDDLISNAVGTSTANQIRKEFVSMTEAESKAQEAALKEKNTFVNKALSDGDINDVTIGTYKEITGKDFNVGDFDETAMRFAIGQQKYSREEISAAKARLELEGAGSTRGKRLAKQTAIREATVLRDEMVTATSGTFTALQQSISSATDAKGAGGVQVTPEEKAAIEQIMGQVELQVALKADQLISGINKKSRSYAEYITDETDRNDVKAILLGPVQTIRNALTNGETGILTAIQRDAAVRKLAQDNKTLQDGDFLQLLDTATKIYGTTKVNDIMAQLAENPDPSKIANPQDRAVAQKIQLLLMNGDSPARIFEQGFKSGDINDPSTVPQTISSNFSILTDPASTKEQKQKVLKQMFAERENGILDQFNGQSAEMLFDVYMNPSVIEAAKGTEYAEDVYRWGLYQAKVLMKPLAEQIVDTQTFTDGGEIVFNPGSGRFEYTSKATSGPYDMWKSVKGGEAVSKINKYLDRMEPIAAMNGDDVDTFLSTIFMGSDYKKLSKEGSIWTRMRDSFFEGMKNPTKDEGGGDTSPPPFVPGDGSSLNEDTGKILSFIGNAEGADYQTLFGGKRVDLQNMTVAEVQKLQRSHSRKTGSSATGAYQVMRKTLEGLIAEGVVSPDEQFTPQVQDRIGQALLQRRGYGDWKAGIISTEEFADSLAKEWASLPTSSGKSYYHGDSMGNKATRSRKKLIATLEGLRG